MVLKLMAQPFKFAMLLLVTATFLIGCGLDKEEKKSNDAVEDTQPDSKKSPVTNEDTSEKKTNASTSAKEDLSKVKEEVEGEELEDADEEEGAAAEEEEEETDSEAESSDLISQILPLLSGKGGSGGLNAGILSSLLGGGGAGGLASLLGGVSGTMNNDSATNALSALSNNQLKTLLGQLKP
jgi:hypothetical protein